MEELIKTDYTFEGLIPDHTFIQKSTSAFEVTMIFNVEIKG